MNIQVDWTITVGNVLTIIGMAAAAISAFVYQRIQIDRKPDRKELASAISDLEKKVGDLEMDMVKNYVSVTHLGAVEERMTASMKVVADEVRGLRSDLLSLYKERAGAGS